MSSHQQVALGVLAVALVIIVIVDQVMQRMGSRVLSHLPVADQAVFATRYRLLRRTSEAVIVFVALIIVLWSFDQTRSAAQTVLASSAVLGLVVGFAARSTLANFVAGVMIAINQPVRLGDRVSVGDAEGTVEDIGLAYTRLRTPDNRRVLIPNEELANSARDQHDHRRPRLAGPGAPDAAADGRPGPGARHPRRAGRRGRRPAARAARGPAPAVAEVTADGTIYTVGVWMPDAAQAAVAASALRERCITRLHEEGMVAEAVTGVATP